MSIVPVAIENTASDTITIRRHIPAHIAHSKKIRKKFNEEMRKLARSMAKSAYGLNRPLMSALIDAFDYQDYEAFVTGSPENNLENQNIDMAPFLELQESEPAIGDEEPEKLDKNTVFFLMPPGFRFEEIIPSDKGSVLFLAHRTDLDSDLYVAVESPHKAKIILFRDEGGELCVPYSDGFIPFKFTPQALAAIKGSLGRQLREAHREGLSILSRKDSGRSGHALREKARLTERDFADLEEDSEDAVFLPGGSRPIRKRKQPSANPASQEVVTEQQGGALGKAEAGLSVPPVPVRDSRNSGVDTGVRDRDLLVADRNRYRIIVENKAKKAAKTLADAAKAEKDKKDLETAILHFEEKLILGAYPNKTERKKDEDRLDHKRAALKKTNKWVEQAWEAAFKADKCELEARIQLGDIERKLGSHKENFAHASSRLVAEPPSAKAILRLRASYEAQQHLAQEMDALARLKAKESADLNEAAVTAARKIEVLSKTAQSDKERERLRELRRVLGQKQAKAAYAKKQADEIAERAKFVAGRLRATVKILMPNREILRSSSLPAGVTEGMARRMKEKAAANERRCAEAWGMAKGELTKARNMQAKNVRIAAHAERRRQIRKASAEVVAWSGLSSARRLSPPRPNRFAPSVFPKTRREPRSHRNRDTGYLPRQYVSSPRRPWYMRLADMVP